MREWKSSEGGKSLSFLFFGVGNYFIDGTFDRTLFKFLNEWVTIRWIALMLSFLKMKTFLLFGKESVRTMPYYIHPLLF